jgi:5'-phosphate synthase pdxT subunit
MIVGVLGLQGAVREHVLSLEALGVESRVVRQPPDLDGLDALILPGGESTTMALLGERGILGDLRTAAEAGFPMFGTCAGMILLAAEAEGRKTPGLDAIDITVARNASGRQVDSFETTLAIEGVGDDVPAVFIRAPYVTRVGDAVTPMASYNGFVVMAREGNVLVASFHPELTDDLRVHRFFVEEVAGKGKENQG